VSQVRVAAEFSPYLGGRYRDDGPWSGEQFREEVLVPRLQQAIQSDGHLVLVLDGVAGVPSSFLEEAFGGLLRATEWKLEQLRDILEIKADDPDLWPYIKLADRFMAEAARRH
jgi:hypothetical protein